MKNITALSLYIINNVKRRRLIIGLSSKALSRILGYGEEYVANIESKRQAQYSHIDYPAIATALNWEPHDLLPDNDQPYSDGELVEKNVLSLDNPEEMEIILIGMKKNLYFNSPKSINEILDYLYLTTSDRPNERRKDLQSVLNKLVNRGVIKVNEDLYFA